jgi:hypothetical protein
MLQLEVLEVLDVLDVKDLEKYFNPGLFSLFKKRRKSNTALKSLTTRRQYAEFQMRTGTTGVTARGA